MGSVKEVVGVVKTHEPAKKKAKTGMERSQPSLIERVKGSEMVLGAGGN